MNKKILKSLVSVFVATLMLTSSIAVFAADGIISPWNTTYTFNGGNSNVKWDGSEAKEGYKWPSTYNYLITYENAPIAFTDRNDDGVLDSATKTAGDKYLRLRSLRTEVDAETGAVTEYKRTGITGIMQFNQFSSTNAKRVNGGLSTGIVSYEVDIRLDELRGAIYNDNSQTAGRLYFNTYDASTNSVKTLLTIYIYHNNSDKNTWYFSCPTSTGGTTSPKGFTAGDWIRCKVTIDVPNSTYTMSVKPISTVSGSTSGSWTIGPYLLKEAVKGIPASTHMALRAPCTCTTSIDNMSVTKETFVVDESKTTITSDGTNVNANVTIGNCVYADADTLFGDAVNMTSPVAILALYNKEDGSLIEVDFKSVEYEDKHAVSNDTDKEKYFKAAPEYKNISLSVKKPGVEYEAKVMVWNNMTKMVPYTASYPAPVAE